MDIGRFVTSSDELMQSIFPDMIRHFHDHQWLSEHAILAPKHDTAGLINEKLLQQGLGEVKIYKCIDTASDTSEANQYPIKFLNSFELPGVLSHRLQLKIGSPIILLRNLKSPKLCNGTHLAIKQLFDHVYVATIICGTFKGEKSSSQVY